MMTEPVLNFLYFSCSLVMSLLFFIFGLALGLFQLYIGQRHFEIQQREKMDELRDSLIEIQEDIAELNVTSSEWTQHREARFFNLIEAEKTGREQAAEEIAEGASTEIREVVFDVLEQVGVPVEPEGIKELLEKQISQALERSASRVIDDQTNENPLGLTSRQLEVARLLVTTDLSNNQIMAQLGIIRPNTYYKLRSTIYEKTGTRSRSELKAKFANMLDTDTRTEQLQ
jgi:DNA-binding CsgD family transcriptional regulator